jgi:hypothetical protein
MGIRLFASLVLAAALPAAAPGLAAAQTRPAIGHPTRATDVVIRVSSGGGFVPVQVNLRALPSFTLYGDGTLIVPGAVPLTSPGPAIMPLLRSRLSERQVQALLRRAQAAGLLAPGVIEYGDMGSIGVSDMPTTTLTVNARGRHVQRAAYALGVTGHGGRMPAAQTLARRALARFIAQLPRGLRGTHYAPHAIAVYVGPFPGAPPTASRRVRWPLTSDLAQAGTPVSSGLGYRCITVGGKDARTLVAVLRTANDQSRWIARAGATAVYQLIARPLLPDQRTCASPGA